MKSLKPLPNGSNGSGAKIFTAKLDEQFVVMNFNSYHHELENENKTEN